MQEQYIHISTKHQLIQNNAEHVFNITNQLSWNMSFNFKNYPNIIHLLYYLSFNKIKGGTFTSKHFCWVPRVLILYKCVGLRIFVLYIVKLINRKGFTLEYKHSQYIYTLWTTTISWWTLWMLELNVMLVLEVELVCEVY